VSPSIPWEVIVVDNASTDNTTAVAHQYWPSDVPTSLRVVYEPRLGLSHARRRGFSEASYGVVSFGTRDLKWVRDYIRNQCDRHACGKVEARLERITDYEAEAEPREAP